MRSSRADDSLGGSLPPPWLCAAATTPFSVVARGRPRTAPLRKKDLASRCPSRRTTALFGRIIFSASAALIAGECLPPRVARRPPLTTQNTDEDRRRIRALPRPSRTVPSFFAAGRFPETRPDPSCESVFFMPRSFFLSLSARIVPRGNRVGKLPWSRWASDLVGASAVSASRHPMIPLRIWQIFPLGRRWLASPRPRSGSPFSPGASRLSHHSATSRRARSRMIAAMIRSPKHRSSLLAVDYLFRLPAQKTPPPAGSGGSRPRSFPESAPCSFPRGESILWMAFRNERFFPAALVVPASAPPPFPLLSDVFSYQPKPFLRCSRAPSEPLPRALRFLHCSSTGKRRSFPFFPTLSLVSLEPAPGRNFRARSLEQRTLNLDFRGDRCDSARLPPLFQMAL